MPMGAAGCVSVMDERVSRGALLAQRRKALGIFSASEFARRTGKNRDTIAAAEAGRASEATYDELEAWLCTVESPHAEDQAPAEDLIEFDITGPRTEWHVVVRGPVEKADEMRRQVSELLRDIEHPQD